MPTVDYLPIATTGTPNVDTQADFLGSTYQEEGFQAGLAQSKQLNKCWRQASMVGACIANFISQVLAINVLDDGNIANLIANFILALKGLGRRINLVGFSATPVFDASAADIQEITLTGNVTSSTCPNLAPGQRITFIIHQDGTGGRTFAWPSAFSAIAGTIDPGASNTSMQTFITDSNTVPHPDGGMTVS